MPQITLRVSYAPSTAPFSALYEPGPSARNMPESSVYSASQRRTPTSGHTSTASST